VLRRCQARLLYEGVVLNVRPIVDPKTLDDEPM
jgi:hypothetical protein